ncbi:hypothetical protein A2W13_03500 [Candidatus Woesebacteria bacterium RBG_16_36_11]|uniref:Uncharacterized protein n=1 Tax=Candidatus Woesebacteria bacterium RBG_16_36_11 TaxID=1802481 RepID=A0A1F7XBH1_9BACT|nr:MAG: hypothetical protein A2W13_03500 [Candidatus Woesebacteria bacterium RBG_16_36_11]
MAIEALRKQISDRLKGIGKPKTYPGMSTDINLVASAIIPEVTTKNVETVSNYEISEGTPQDALERLLRIRNLNQIAKAINREYGHYNTTKEDIDHLSILTDRLNELQNPKK